MTTVARAALLMSGHCLDDARLEGLVSETWQRYGQAIETGDFSYRRGVFQPFDNDDSQADQVRSGSFGRRGSIEALGQASTGFHFPLGQILQLIGKCLNKLWQFS
jgi:hypothetical protein